jgi:hypothetical protein
MWVQIPMSEAATPPARKRRAQKKWPLRRAAKFREETPRKGGGLAIKDRDTALQQYDEVPAGLQAAKYNSSRQNAAESLEKFDFLSRFCPDCRLLHQVCDAINCHNHERGGFITLPHTCNKRFV